MHLVQKILVTEHEAEQRLDNFLIRILKGVPKSYLYRLIREGQVRVNKKRVQPSVRLVVGDCVRIPPIRVAAAITTKIESPAAVHLLQAILYEDDKILVINKPAGLAVHGGSGVSFGVIELLRQARSDLVYLELVHRLDKETSGCLLLAKKRSALRALHTQFLERSIEKKYWALLSGQWFGKKECTVDAPLLKNILASGERVVRVSEQGKPSKTVVTLLENSPLYSFVEAMPHTGRTHQIRVHCAYLGHPIVGDAKYSKRIDQNQKDSTLPERLYLHARSLRFSLNDKTYALVAELDEKFKKALAKLEMKV